MLPVLLVPFAYWAMVKKKQKDKFNKILYSFLVVTKLWLYVAFSLW